MNTWKQHVYGDVRVLWSNQQIKFHSYFECYRSKLVIPVNILAFPMTHMRFSIHLNVVRTNWNWFALYNDRKWRYRSRGWKQANTYLSITRWILIGRWKSRVLQQHMLFTMPLPHQHRQVITMVDHDHGLYHRLFHAGKITCQDQELREYSSDRSADWCILNSIQGTTWMVCQEGSAISWWGRKFIADSPIRDFRVGQFLCAGQFLSITGIKTPGTISCLPLSLSSYLYLLLFLRRKW